MTAVAMVRIHTRTRKPGAAIPARNSMSRCRRRSTCPYAARRGPHHVIADMRTPAWPRTRCAAHQESHGKSHGHQQASLEAKLAKRKGCRGRTGHLNRILGQQGCPQAARYGGGRPGQSHTLRHIPWISLREVLHIIRSPPGFRVQQRWRQSLSLFDQDCQDGAARLAAQATSGEFCRSYTIS